MFHIALPAVACRDRILLSAGNSTDRPLLQYMMPGGTDMGECSGWSPGFGTAGRRVEVCGFCYAAKAFGLDTLGPGNAEPVTGSPAGGQFPGLDPVVDDGGAGGAPVGGV